MTPRALARILIVDDDPDVREVIELTLGGQGYDVTSVGGGQAALAQLARETFDLIVCDLGMPEVDGIALYGALQRRPAPRPVVLFLSGFQDNARYETFLRETGVPRLVKPFEVTVQLLRRRLRENHPALMNAAPPPARLQRAQDMLEELWARVGETNEKNRERVWRLVEGVLRLALDRLGTVRVEPDSPVQTRTDRTP